MRSRNGILALLLALVASTAHAQTSPSCAQLPNVICATGSQTVTTNITFNGTLNATGGTIRVPNSTTVPGTCTVGDLYYDNNAAQGARVWLCTATNTFTAIDETGTGAVHALLSATHSDTVASTVVRGGLIVGNSTPAWAQLAIGATATFLRSNGTDPAWTALAAADIGPGDLANALVWQTVCTADPCVLSPVPRADGTLLVQHRGLIMRQVAAAPGINEIEFTTPNIDFNASQGVSTGVDSAIVYYEL